MNEKKNQQIIMRMTLLTSFYVPWMAAWLRYAALYYMLTYDMLQLFCVISFRVCAYGFEAITFSHGSLSYEITILFFIERYCVSCAAAFFINLIKPYKGLTENCI